MFHGPPIAQQPIPTAETSIPLRPKILFIFSSGSRDDAPRASQRLGAPAEQGHQEGVFPFGLIISRNDVTVTWK
jgi:hypothetical protein